MRFSAKVLDQGKRLGVALSTRRSAGCTVQSNAVQMIGTCQLELSNYSKRFGVKTSSVRFRILGLSAPLHITHHTRILYLPNSLLTLVVHTSIACHPGASNKSLLFCRRGRKEKTSGYETLASLRLEMERLSLLA